VLAAFARPNAAMSLTTRDLVAYAARQVEMSAHLKLSASWNSWLWEIPCDGQRSKRQRESLWR
jgi:hypothetical protein